jgi:putative ABC transport system permease protein
LEEEPVRVADILGLAISALWQQKARTFLTTLGVVFGSFVLAASLSIGQGVQETIGREARRNTHLREVQVRAGWKTPRPDAPGAGVPVKGDMSDSRRERIRKALAVQSQRFNYEERRVYLTRQRLRALGAIEHVEQTVPVVQLYGWAVLDQNSETTGMVSASPDNAYLRNLVTAGRFFAASGEQSALVSEFLLYRLGITDEVAIDGVLGKKLTLEIRSEKPGGGLGIFLQKPGGAEATREESAVLDKLKQQLPEALDKFDLAAPEKDALRKALQTVPPLSVVKHAEDFTIVGVLRMPAEDDQEWRWNRHFADVVLPVEAAEGLFFRSSVQDEPGLEEAILLVDREDHVKEVLKQVRELNLNGWAAVEFIERERLLYLLIFGAMTFVAGVALLVAALGIANTMLMSVLERTREVGIMKAVGAGNGHIQLIFLVEGAIIGLVGGGFGLLLAWAASFPGDSWIRSMVSRDLHIDLKESLFVFPLWLVLMVGLFAVLVTTLAAVYPARRAAKVNTVTALRHE